MHKAALCPVVGEVLNESALDLAKAAFYLSHRSRLSKTTSLRIKSLQSRLFIL